MDQPRVEDEADDGPDRRPRRCTMKMRWRSSSRCSTSDASSPWSRRRGSLIRGTLNPPLEPSRRRARFRCSGSASRSRCRGGVLRGRQRERRPAPARLRRRKLRAGVDLRRLLHPGDGVLELPHADAERAADLRQPLRAEEQQGKDQQKDQVMSVEEVRCSHAIDRTTRPSGRRNAISACRRESVRSACGRRGVGAGYDAGSTVLAERAGGAVPTDTSRRRLAWHCWS